MQPIDPSKQIMGQATEQYNTFSKYPEIQQSYRKIPQEQNIQQTCQFLSKYTVYFEILKIHYTQNMFIAKLITIAYIPYSISLLPKINQNTDETTYLIGADKHTNYCKK